MIIAFHYLSYNSPYLKLVMVEFSPHFGSHVVLVLYVSCLSALVLVHMGLGH